MLDARRLQVLQAVVDSGSITAAATALGYTPSAVSQSIAALEREAKLPLFEKVGRGIRPTQAGHLLAQHAKAVTERLRIAEEALEALRAGQAGRLRLAAFASAGATLVPRAMARFREAHPGMELDLEIAEPDEALVRLRSGHTDLAVITRDGALDEGTGDLFFTHLIDDPYCVVLPRRHPLADAEMISLEDMAQEPWIATASARCSCQQVVTTACARAGFSPRFAIEADEFSTTVGFVAAGLGVAMVPMLALSSIPDDVRVCRLRGDAPKRRVYAVTRRSSAHDPVAGVMVEALRASVKSHLKAAA